MVEVPAAAATFTATLPEVDPLRVSCPPVPLFAPEERTPVAATLDGVIAPSTIVKAGVLVAVATVQETPLAVVQDTLVTVPVPPDTVAHEVVVPFVFRNFPLLPV